MSITKSEAAKIRAQIARAAALPNEFLDCRSLGHAWHEVVPDRDVPHGELHAYQCGRCLMLRRDVIAPMYGEILSRNYDAQPGYYQRRTESGDRPFSAPALRAERSRRIKQKLYELTDIVIA